MNVKDSFKKATRNINQEWKQLVTQEKDTRQNVPCVASAAVHAASVKFLGKEHLAHRKFVRKKSTRSTLILRAEAGLFSKEQALDKGHSFCKTNGFDPLSDALDNPALNTSPPKTEAPAQTATQTQSQRPAPIPITPPAVKAEAPILKSRKMNLKRRPK